MRADIFQSKKCVHIKLDKNVHASLRAELFRRGLSMQEIFDDFATLVVKGDSRCARMLDQLSMRKLQNKLDGIPRRGVRPVGDMDADTLYDLIEGGSNQRGDAVS